MLLPESFHGGIAPEAFLAWDTGSRMLAGAAAYHRAGGETVRVQVFVLRAHRRQGIGSLLLRRVCERASERQDVRVRTSADLSTADPATEPFLAANGFERGPRFHRIEGDIAAGRVEIAGLRQRLQTAAKIPRDAQVIPAKELPADVVRSAYQALISPVLRLPPESARYSVVAPDFQGLVLRVSGQPVGFVSGDPGATDRLARLDVLSVLPEFRGGWGWATILLLDTAVTWAAEAGASRVLFDVEESNWMVLRLANRITEVSTRVLARFTRPV